MKELKIDSDDQESVYSEKSASCKSLQSYDDSESSTCDSIITNFNHCSVNSIDLEKVSLSPLNEEVEIEEDEFTNDSDISVNEISLVEISSLSNLTETIEPATTPVSIKEKEEPRTKDSSTNTENYGYRRKMFRPSNNGYFKYRQYRPYGYRHSNYRSPYYRSNYQRPFYNNYQQTQFNYMNNCQSRMFCNRWDCELRSRQNQHFKTMLLRGIFHFTKCMEFIAQTHF